VAIGLMDIVSEMHLGPDALEAIIALNSIVLMSVFVNEIFGPPISKYALIRGNNMEEFIVVMATSQKGVDFEAIDNKKARLFFMILAPLGEASNHLKILAMISRTLSLPGEHRRKQLCLKPLWHRSGLQLPRLKRKRRCNFFPLFCLT